MIRLGDPAVAGRDLSDDMRPQADLEVRLVQMPDPAVVSNNVELTSGTTEINKSAAGTMDLSQKNARLIVELWVAMDRFKT